MNIKQLTKKMKGKTCTHLLSFINGKIPAVMVSVHFPIDEQAINAALDLSKYDKEILKGNFKELSVSKHTGRYNNGKEVIANIYSIAL